MKNKRTMKEELKVIRLIKIVTTFLLMVVLMVGCVDGVERYIYFIKKTKIELNYNDVVFKAYFEDAEGEGYYELYLSGWEYDNLHISEGDEFRFIPKTFLRDRKVVFFDEYRTLHLAENFSLTE